MHDLELHHVGMIVSDLDKAEKNLIHGDLVNQVYDPIQDANLRLYKNHGSSFLELIQPLSEKSMTWNQLQKNSDHINHFCYSAKEKELIDIVSKEHKLIKITDFMPAQLFPGHEVIFFYSRSKVVIEFLINN